LIFRASLVTSDKGIEEVDLVEDDACMYDLLGEALVFFLKYFEILLTSFCDLAGIGGRRDDTKVGLTISLPFRETLGLET